MQVEAPVFHMNDKWIAIGRITGPVGLHGKVKALSYSEIPGRFEKIHKIFVELPEGLRGFLVDEVEETERGLVLSLRHVNTREDASRLNGADILIPFEDRIDPPEGMYFVFELVGAVVEEENGSLLGRVEDVMTDTAQDILVVRTPKGEELLIPVVDAFVKVMDIEHKKVVVSLLEGMRPGE